MAEVEIDWHKVVASLNRQAEELVVGMESGGMYYREQYVLVRALRSWARAIYAGLEGEKR